MTISKTVVAIAATVLALLPGMASGQTEDGGLRLVAAVGPTINDFETSGVELIFVGGFEYRFAGWPTILTADIRYFSWEPADREQLIMPELGLQFGASLGPVSPFVGLGGGMQFARRSGDNASSWCTHLSTGMRIRLSSGVDLRLEMRGRTIDPAIGITGGFAIGL